MLNLGDNQKLKPRLSCDLVTISAMHSTSNVASFTADCKTIMLVYMYTILRLICKMAVENRKYK